jgi:hypothetical protein
MKEQTYHNHKRYYWPHHFVFLPLMGILIGFSLQSAYKDVPHRLQWIMFLVISFCMLYLAIMLRQHYALGNQDRIVRLEFRLRYYERFGRDSKNIEEKLSFKEIAALRFASDDEFSMLLNRALKENLSTNQIKKSVKHWQADNERI